MGQKIPTVSLFNKLSLPSNISHPPGIFWSWLKESFWLPWQSPSPKEIHDFVFSIPAHQEVATFPPPTGERMSVTCPAHPLFSSKYFALSSPPCPVLPLIEDNFLLWNHSLVPYSVILTYPWASWVLCPNLLFINHSPLSLSHCLCLPELLGAEGPALYLAVLKALRRNRSQALLLRMIWVGLSPGMWSWNPFWIE